MNPKAFLSILLVLGTAELAAKPDRSIPENEQAIMNDIHAAARTDEIGKAEVLLMQDKDQRLKASHEIIVLRRAVSVCAQLNAENEHGRAAKLAGAILKRLSKGQEKTPEARAERLYLEAWLQGHVLGDNLEAKALLEIAATLLPNHPEIARMLSDVDLALASAR